MTSTNEYLSAEALATRTSYVKILCKPPSLTYNKLVWKEEIENNTEVETAT